MKKVLILLFSLSFFGLDAQVKQQTRTNRKQTIKKNTDGKLVPKYKRFEKTQAKAEKKNQKKAAPTFEGAIKLINSDVKGLKGEFLIDGKKVAAILPGATKAGSKFFILNDERAEISLQTQQGSKLAIKQRRTPLSLPKGLSTGKKDKGVAKIIKTGKTKTIGEYKCHEVTIKDNVTDFQAWVTMQVPVNIKDILPMTVTVAEYLNLVNSRDGIMHAMVMEATQRDIASGKSFTITAQVEKKKIKDKEFKIPDGYRLVDQTRMSTNVRAISPAASVGAAQNKAKDALKKMQDAHAKEAPATPASPIKE